MDAVIGTGEYGEIAKVVQNVYNGKQKVIQI